MPKTKKQLNEEIRRELSARSPSMSYDRWSVELGDAAGRIGASVKYGPTTHDAWRAGKSPAEHAAWLLAMAPKKPPARAPSTDHLEKIVIEHDVVPNKNTRAGGFLPVIRINGGRQRGDTWAATGLPRRDAEAAALADASEEAGKYGGDYRVIVKKG